MIALWSVKRPESLGFAYLDLVGNTGDYKIENVFASGGSCV